MVATRSARARKCAFTSLPESVLFESLRLLELKDLGSAIVALGIKSPPLAILVDEALVSNMHSFSANFVDDYGHYGYAVANDHSDCSGALHFTVRAPCPFEARCRYFRAKVLKLDEAHLYPLLEAHVARLSDAFYVHDMSVFEDAHSSENCTLLSLADVEDAANPRRVLFLVSLGIQKDSQHGPGHAGRHSIAVDVLLPELDRFHNLWLYDFDTSMSQREFGWCDEDDQHYRHLSNECRLDAAARSRLNRACGLETSEGADLRQLVELVSLLGGASGRASGCLDNAFDNFLEQRAKYGKWCARAEEKKAAKKSAVKEDETAKETESDDDDYDEEDGDSMINDYGSIDCEVAGDEPGYWKYPAGPDGNILCRGAECYGGSPEIRKQLLDWLPTIDRSSLGAVVAATQGFGARFTDDCYEQEEERMHLERLEEEKGFASRVAGRVRTWLGGGNA